MPKPVAAACVLAAAAALAWALWPPAEDAPRPPAAPTTDAPAPPAGGTGSLTAAVPPATAEPEDRSQSIELPDGTWVATLNGVRDAPPFHWDRYRPWSPIVGVRANDPWDWYEHADGSFSTTIMAYRKDLGRTDATTLVVHPGEAIGTIVDGAGNAITVPSRDR